MSTSIHFERVDDYTADLLDLIANEQSPPVDREWSLFRQVIAAEADSHAGRLDPNRIRDRIAGQIAARRVGAFYSRACREGLIRATGEWTVSTDKAGRNSGKPCRMYEVAS